MAFAGTGNRRESVTPLGLGNGLKPDIDGFATIVAWLKVPAEQFFVDNEKPLPTEATQPDLMAQLAPLLRARKDLSETDVEYLQRVFAATLEPRASVGAVIDETWDKTEAKRLALG